jgi:hypothetical protein
VRAGIAAITTMPARISQKPGRNNTVALSSSCSATAALNRLLRASGVSAGSLML